MYYRYPSVLGTPRKRSEQPLIQALESCVQPRECSRKPERNSSQGREVIEGDIDLREVFARQVYVACEERVLVNGSQCWRQPAIEINDPIVSERLEEHPASVRFHQARKFGKSLAHIEVVQNAVSTDNIETSRRKCRLLSVHLNKVGANPLRARF